VGIGENLPAIAGEAPAPAPPSPATSAIEPTIAPATTVAAVAVTAVPVTAVPVTAPVMLATGTTGPVWWEVGVSGAAALVAAVGVWRFLVSTQRRRRYDRVLGRVADLQLPARS
jgi:hypothetical protein